MMRQEKEGQSKYRYHSFPHSNRGLTKIQTMTNSSRRSNITMGAFDLKSLMYNMLVVPVNFSTEHKKMLAHCKQLLELNNGCIAINADKHGKLITALRTAVENGEGMLDKEATSHDDLLDAFRLSMQFWH